MERVEDDFENTQTQKKSLKETIFDKLSEFDMYAQNLNLTYKEKSTFKTKYGIIFSILTVFISILIIIDSVVFYKPKNVCSFSQIDDTLQTSFQIDLKNQFFMFYAVYDKSANAYVDPEQQNMFTGKLDVYSKSIVNNKVNLQPFNNGEILFSLCTSPPQLDSNFLSVFTAPIFCPSTETISLSDVNIYMTEIHFTLVNRIQNTEIATANYKNLVLELYFTAYSYDSVNEQFKIGYSKNSFKFSDFAFGNPVYEGFLYKDSYIFYNGYFNMKSEETIYSASQLEHDVTQLDTSDNILQMKFLLPYYANVNYYQKFNIVSSLGIAAGWLLIVTMIVGFFVGKCTRLKLYESIANDAFSMITPEGNKKVEETTKNIKDKLVSDKVNLLELIVDDAHKYTLNDQLHLNFLQIISYLFCCDCFKSTKTRATEKTLHKALSELFKTIDIINVVKTCQEIRLLKEIIFQPYQKRLFENLIHPIVTSDEVKCAYDIEYLETKAKNEKEKDAMSRANLKDSLIQLSSSESYNEIDTKLINLLNISPDFKNVFFKLDEKTEIVKDKYYSLATNPNVHNRTETVKNFKNFVKDLSYLIEEYKIVNNSLILETNDIMKNYKTIFEENKILKEILYGDILVQNGYKKDEIKNSNLIISYHPIILPKENNREQIEFSRNINIVSKRRGCLYHIERIVNGFFNVIDIMLCIKGKHKALKREYNNAVRHSFDAIKHCIRISFLSFLVFLYFFIKTMINNLSSSKCDISYLCYGFLSFQILPSDISFAFTFSLIFYMLVLFVYTLNLIIKNYLSKVDNEFIKKNYNYSKTLFSSPSLKIIIDEDSKYQRDNIISIFTAIDKHFNDKHFRSTLINTLIFIANLIAIVINAWLTLIFINQLKDATPDNYTMKIFLISLVLCISTNLLPLVSTYLIRLHRNIMPSTLHIIQFWLPFISKYISYILFLTVNFQIFMYSQGSYFHTTYSIPFNNQMFICREDQTAYNLIIFMLIEFLLRKVFNIVFSFSTVKRRISYNVEYSIIHTMCNFLLFSTIILVYPFQGLITFFILFFDYNIEYLILRKCKSKPHSHNNDSKYETYNIICLFLNLVVLVVINVIFQNQYAILGNAVPEIVENPSLRNSYPPMCLHQSVNDDFQTKFRAAFSTFSLAIYESVQNFILLPSLFGIIFVLIYSKNLVSQFISDMKILLTTFEDHIPNKQAERLELTKKVMTLLKKLDNFTKNNLNENLSTLEDKKPKIRPSLNEEEEEIEVKMKSEEDQ